MAISISNEKRFIIEDGVLKGFSEGHESETDIAIPYGVTSIDNCAFCGCSSLTSVKIPNSVTSIGFGAFCGCSSLIIICEKGSYAEKYAKEHKITYKYATTQTKTKGQVFIELFPACKLCDLGIPNVSPCDIDQRTNYTLCSCFDECVKCKKAYWSEPIND